MHVVIFCHSLISDWNHGNAHFLRGVAGELQRRGHTVAIWEPQDGWSITNLIAEQGAGAIAAFERTFPHLRITRYVPDALDLDAALGRADLALVHEWTPPDIVARIGAWRAAHDHCRVLFHDTHHRAVSDRDGLAACDLRHYDGVLAFGRVVCERYLAEGWAQHVWTWHEAADTSLFSPQPSADRDGDLVWVGNWGDDERSAELQEFLIEPVAALGLSATVYGVRYPPHAIDALARAGIRYGGWLPNHEVPRVFGRHAVTVHVPRRPYTRALPGIPTIRPFEAMSCGIPLVSAPWHDAEGLFTAGRDYLVARDRAEMTRHLAHLIRCPEVAAAMAARARRTILRRHTCAHRVDELLWIHAQLPRAAAAEVDS